LREMRIGSWVWDAAYEASPLRPDGGVHIPGETQAKSQPRAGFKRVRSPAGTMTD